MSCVTLDVAAEYVYPNLSQYREQLKTLEIHTSTHGYHYFIEYFQITFFRRFNNCYHVVICQLSDSLLTQLEITYDDLIACDPVFVFNQN